MSETDHNTHEHSLPKRREGCVVTNAVYGGLRICYKNEGDPLDFETLWYIFLTLRRIDELVQLIVKMDPLVMW